MSNELNLTKFSTRNLNVIQNFLLYAGLEEEYSKTAIDYILEDHVDGEDSQEALLERALGCELILNEVYLFDDTEEKFPHDIYSDSKTGLIYAVSTIYNEVTIYKLTKEQSLIEVEDRDEILKYCLAVVTEDDFVTLGDIFLHGKYVEKLG